MWFYLSLIDLLKVTHIQQLKKDPSKLNFDRVVFCNIGNPQQLNQKPITFFRQVCIVFPGRMSAIKLKGFEIGCFAVRKSRIIEGRK